jgi:glycyl-tRNA synthetase (class II)
MSDNSLPTTLPTVPTTRQKLAVPGRSRRNAVSGKLKVALEAMVWDNLTRKEAAALTGLADSSLRFAFRKPHVMAHYHAELAALRNNLRAKNIHRLDGIADKSDNDMARVASIKAMEQIADQADEKQRPGAGIMPGLQIVIIGGPTPKVIGPAPITAPAALPHHTIDHEPARIE